MSDPLSVTAQASASFLTLKNHVPVGTILFNVRTAL